MGVWDYLFGGAKKVEAKPETVPPQAEPVKPVKYGATNRLQQLEDSAGIETVPPPPKQRTYK